MIWAVIAITVFVLLISFIGIGVKVFFKKGGEFSGTCASNNPYLRDKLGDCPVCGGNVDKCESNNEEQNKFEFPEIKPAK